MSLELASSHAISNIVDVPVKDIQISTDNVRHFDPTRDLDELAASIRLHGLLHRQRSNDRKNLYVVTRSRKSGKACGAVGDQQCSKSVALSLKSRYLN